ncbi:MAG TPA: DUF4294 domain-containing protein [Bacteroidales bacterium]|jgi:hypothetical protein|nr:DUF4294 domain-containing protein [Bacteroidales bacterium]HNV94951.1 DUF4294 domain-containing protein [Bacteroidales bacterium]HOU98476.1 DUF4294 domain-containing protein [Bacteroidales bacterium]
MRIKILILNFLFFYSLEGIFAQGDSTNTPKPQGYLVYTKVINGDTLPIIYLREITIFPPRVFKSKREAARYTKLVRKIKKVLPYAKLAKLKIMLIEIEMKKIPTEEGRKEFLKMAEKKLRADFEDEIKNMTMSEGRILIKLIDRETGKTSYELIKQLKGSFNAFLYQQVARLFGENLKDEYDAKGEDKYIEEIVTKIENGEL